MMLGLSRAGLVVLAAALVTACGRGDRVDDTTTDTAAVAVVPSDTGAPAAPARTPAKDADHEFLRGMTDHHEGLIAMASAAMTKGSTDAAKADAHELHLKQEAEKKEMIRMAQESYGDTIAPHVMPKHAAMNDSLQAMSGPAYDRTFYRMVAQHHREGIAMIDQHLPRLTKPAVKEMAEKMKREQQAEIAEFEKKMAEVRG